MDSTCTGNSEDGRSYEVRAVRNLALAVTGGIVKVEAEHRGQVGIAPEPEEAHEHQHRYQNGVDDAQRRLEHERDIDVLGDAQRQHDVTETVEIRPPLPGILDRPVDDHELEESVEKDLSSRFFAFEVE